MEKSVAPVISSVKSRGSPAVQTFASRVAETPKSLDNAPQYELGLPSSGGETTFNRTMPDL